MDLSHLLLIVAMAILLVRNDFAGALERKRAHGLRKTHAKSSPQNIIGIEDGHVKDIPNSLDHGDKQGVEDMNEHTLDAKRLEDDPPEENEWLWKRMGTNSYVIQKIAKMLANKGVVVDPSCKIKGFDKDSGKVVVHKKGPLTGDKEPNCYLSVLPAMLNKMPAKKCQKLTDYRLAPLDEDWQCGNNEKNPNFDYYKSNDTKRSTIFPGNFYLPNREVKSVVAEFAEVPDITIDEFMLFSGTTGEERVRGRWCGMPAPPDQPKKGGTPHVQSYWKECVMGRAGYFNVLMCDGGDQSDPGDSTYAVLGIAALNPNVCYGAHSHLNEEAYWQLGGGGLWRTWRKHAKLNTIEEDYYKDPVQDIQGCSEMNPCQWPYPLHNHPAGVIHEMDTTRDQKPMVMAYWWAKDNVIKNIKYHFASYVGTKGSCANPRRVPDIDLGTESVICNPVPESGKPGADYQYGPDTDARTLKQKLAVALNEDLKQSEPDIVQTSSKTEPKVSEKSKPNKKETVLTKNNEKQPNESNQEGSIVYIK